MSNNTQQTTFWEFLKKQKIEIPIIQRDYAQGRKGKEKLREKFLADLKNALDSDKEQNLILDFVYGNIESETDSLNPLDGQQRLTTLWLLHWYIAYRADRLAEYKDIFKRFAYETRVSSREFCEKLSDFAVLQPEDTGIVEYVTNQTWFFSEWKQYPTIQAMLNMLGGTPDTDKKGNDIVDGIEELFGDLDKVKYEEYWQRLTKEDNCPIIFYYLPLYELKLSDDLYIKMNARGKQLTNFENFKADLVGHIKEQEWDDNKNLQDTVAHKLDTDWTNLFWKNHSPEYKIDEIYFAFFNRYFLNALITAKNENDDDYLFKGEDWVKNNKNFQYFDNVKEYTGFDIYNPEENGKDVFGRCFYDKLANVLNNFYNSFKSETKESVNALFLPVWNDKKFKFIPGYEKNNDNKIQPEHILIPVTQPQRVVFHAICRYFETGQYNETTLKQWMRVVWNIVENANITSVQPMIGAMRLIDELGEHSHEIYSWLADDTNKIKSTTASEQVVEEREKAKKINNPTENWEDKIIDAENTAFFKGAIRFLFTKDDGGYDWNLFDDRLTKAKEYFYYEDREKGGVKMPYKTDITIALVKSLDNWDTQLWWDKYIFNTNAETWKSILTNRNYISPVCRIFDATDLRSVTTIDFSDPNPDKVKKQLLEDGVIKYLVEDNYWENSRFRWAYNRPCLYPPHGQKRLFFDWDTNHNEKLKELLDKGIIGNDKQQKIPGNNRLFQGRDIFLKKVGDIAYYWGGELIKWDTGSRSVDNSVTIDTLENYLESL